MTGPQEAPAAAALAVLIWGEADGPRGGAHAFCSEARRLRGFQATQEGAGFSARPVLAESRL